MFPKGGTVWCSRRERITLPVNALIGSVLLQEPGGNSFTHEALTRKYKLDNQFELVFGVGFQKILSTDVCRQIDRWRAPAVSGQVRTEIQQQSALSLLNGTFDFEMTSRGSFVKQGRAVRSVAPTTMKKFEDSEKAKKPARSMIETRESPGKKQRIAKKRGGQEGRF
ncbi:Signal recognition particle receptor subunit alpha [Plecturocebus cupreus]